jgi:hypothetical protein
MTMAGTAPNYDNVQWPGSDGLRVPQETAPATLAVVKMATVNGGGASTVTLTPAQTGASVLVITNMGSVASTVLLPAAFPGHVYAFKNSTGSGSNCTFKVTGQTGVAVADGSHAILVCNTTDIEQYAAAF